MDGLGGNISTRARTATVSVIATALLVSVAAPAQAGPTSAEWWLANKVNAERRARSIPVLRMRVDLSDVARRHSIRMAKKGAVFHNRNLGYEVKAYWYELGENVGRGSKGLSEIHQRFMASTAHRRNILYRRYNAIGVGISHAGGYAYITEVFARL